jgi:hypothetical protein
MHYHEINDVSGDLEDLIPFCSDSCHVEWCTRKRVPYDGWNGAHDDSDVNEYCFNCGVIAGVGCEDESCEHQRHNVIVNRFITEKGERCDHGNWIQLSRRLIGK